MSHPIFRHLLDNGFITPADLQLAKPDLVTAETMREASDRPYHKATSVLDAPDSSLDSPMWGRKRSGTARDFLGRDVLTSADAEKQAENREANDADEFTIARASVLPLSDEDHGIVTVNDKGKYLSEGGGYIVDDTHRRGGKAIRDEAVGVEFEYKRRSQGREPWMPRETYIWLRKLNERRQRESIIRLIGQLGADPRDPEVARWVKDNGYGKALAKLERRARTQKVAA